LLTVVASWRHDIQSRVRSTLTKLYDISVTFTLLHVLRRHKIDKLSYWVYRNHLGPYWYLGVEKQGLSNETA